MRDWVATVETTHYCLGSVMGPHPYPWMVREFHRVIGDEAREQCRRAARGGDPDVVVACVGGGSNAAGIFSGFADARRRAGRRRAGRRRGHRPRRARASCTASQSFLLQDEFGQVLEAESISAGLDYPGVGPEHAHLADIGRARYEPVTDDEVLDAFELLSRTEGIIPALEPAHALAWVVAGAGRRWPARPCWSTCRAGATRTSPRWPDLLGAGSTGTAEVTRLGSARDRACGARRRDGPQAARPLRHRRAATTGSETVRAVAAAGADAIEVGIPFSDPVMDGPTIQEASQRALAGGATPPASSTASGGTSTPASRSS